ncbi:MAG TPA: type II toxin-antitoxin system HicA family toxin [Candidatus Methylacidiphilales bacterium]|nr:type II toxin-antitoxin system HicA family toxin [Candidatus Methylacidiphilales bacterium]
MKRNDLERHLRRHGCKLYREGGKHSVWWNPQNRKTWAVPRHREVNDYTVRGICP